jgi:hypothetical protein
MRARNPRLADKTIVFSEHEIFQSSCHGNTTYELYTDMKLPSKLMCHTRFCTKCACVSHVSKLIEIFHKQMAI